MSTEHDDARPVTIYTVAERAGVSIATVSRVLSGSTPASAMTRQRVLRAVEDLEYVPLRAGRAVDVPSHETHGLVLPGLRGPYYSELLSGFESTAARDGQSVVVVVCDASKDAEASVRKMLGRIDGIVIANDTISDAMVRQIVRTTPTVLVARDADRGLRRRAGRELHQLGRADPAPARPRPHRASSSSATPTTSHDVSERYRGFQHALTPQARRGGGRPDPGRSTRRPRHDASWRGCARPRPPARDRRARLRQRRARPRHDGAPRPRGSSGAATTSPSSASTTS